MLLFLQSEQLQFDENLIGSFLQQDINATFVCKTRIPEFNFNFKGTNKKKNNCVEFYRKNLQL